MSRCVLIPAAGFGRRVGSPTAKEMLPHPRSGRPLIEFSLERARLAKARAHVVTRKEKVNLLSYLADRSREQDISVQLVEATPDWPETLLLSEPQWADANIVCLPDAEFHPECIVESMFESLEQTELSFALMARTDLKTYGALQVGEGGWFHCEKPVYWNESAQAWGLFGFRRAQGRPMLQQLADSTRDHVWRLLPAESMNFSLSAFEDLTRPETDARWAKGR